MVSRGFSWFLMVSLFSCWASWSSQRAQFSRLLSATHETRFAVDLQLQVPQLWWHHRHVLPDHLQALTKHCQSYTYVQYICIHIYIYIVCRSMTKYEYWIHITDIIVIYAYNHIIDMDSMQCGKWHADRMLHAVSAGVWPNSSWNIWHEITRRNKKIQSKKHGWRISIATKNWSLCSVPWCIRSRPPRQVAEFAWSPPWEQFCSFGHDSQGTSNKAIALPCSGMDLSWTYPVS